MPLSDEDLAQVRDALGIDKLAESMADTVQKKINGALTDHAKRATSAIEKLLEPVNAKLVELETKTATPTPPGAGDKSGTAPTLDDSPVVKGIKKQLEDTKKQLDTMAQEKAAERTKARNVTIRQATLEHLGKAGITDSTKQRHALALLQSEGRVRFESDDSDTIVFADAADSFVELEDGLKKWAKGDDGKHFLPGTNTRGSGTRPPATRPGAGGGNAAPNKDDAANALFAELDNALT